MHNLLSALKNALVVEDEYLIAIDIEAALKRLGFQAVEMAGTVQEALERLAIAEIDFATVNIQLRDSDCAPVVDVLIARGIPFVYVSGFTATDRPERPAAPWLTKPLDEDELRAALILACPDRPVQG